MERKIITLVISILSIFNISNAADRYWIAVTPSNWNNTANWSLTTEGAGGASVPNSHDIAIFDAGGPGDCNMDINIIVNTIDAQSSYTGTLTQGTSDIVLIGLNTNFSGGSFAGGTGNITANFNLTIDGATFTSTSGLLSIGGHYTVSSGTFNHNNGTVLLKGSKTITGSHTLNNVTFENAGNTTIVIASTTVLTVSGDLTFGGSGAMNINGGTIHAQGNIFSFKGVGSGTTLIINGTGNQDLTGIPVATTGMLPNVVIDKPSGVLSLFEQVAILGDWTYIRGAVNCVGTVLYYGSKTISGTHALHIVHFRPVGNTSFVIQITDTLTVLDSLIFDGLGNFVLNGGTINAEGDIFSLQGNGGSATININGTGNQRLIGTSWVGIGRLPGVVVDKPSGTLNIVKHVSVRGNWTYIRGNIGGTGTLFFDGSKVIAGKHAINKVHFRLAGSTTVTIQDTLTVLDSLTLGGVGSMALNVGVIDAKGDIIAISGGPGTARINISGTGTQNLTGGAGGLPNTIINKSSGSIILGNDVRVRGLMTFVKGKIISTSTALLVYTQSASVAGASSLSYVEGPVKKEGYVPFTFPIGKGGSYQPLTVSPLQVAFAAYQTEYFDTPQSFGTNLDTGLGSISNCEHWVLEKLTGASPSNITLGWNANSCAVTQSADMRVSRWDGSQWVNHGNGGTTGDPVNGTVVTAAALSDFGAFALGNITITIPTVADIDLGTATDFSLLAGNEIQAVNPILAIGNAGAITAISDSVFASDSLFVPNDPVVQQAIADLTQAIMVAEAIPGTALSGILGGQSVGEGVYDITGNAGLAGTLTLTGDAASIYVFRIDDTLSVDSNAILAMGNVRPENVYWLTLNSPVSIGRNTNFSGIVMARGNILSSSPNSGSLALLSTQGSISLLNTKSNNLLYLFPQKKMSHQNTPDSIITTVANMDVCGNTQLFTLDIYVSGARCDLDVVIDLPDGLDYISGTVTSNLYQLTDNTIQSNNPLFAIENLQFGLTPIGCNNNGMIGPHTTITITYEVFAACGALANDTALAFTSVIFDFADTLDTSDAITINTPFISIPQTNGIVPELLKGNVGDTLCRNIIIKNDGNVALTTAITVLEHFGPSIEIVSLSIDSVSLLLNVNNAGDTLTISIPPGLFPNGQDLPPDSFVTVRECVQIVACTQDTLLGGSVFNYFWECNSAVCQEDSVTASVKVPSANTVGLSFLTGITSPDACYGSGNNSPTEMEITNNGLAPALNVMVELFGGIHSAILNMDFTFIGANSIIDSNYASLGLTFRDTVASPFCRDSVIDSAVFFIGDIGPGDTVTLQWNTINCCPADTVCGNGSSTGITYTYKYQDQCTLDTAIVINRSVFNFYAASEVTYKSGPLQLIGDPSIGVDTGDYAFINTDGLFTWPGDASEMIKAVFTLDPGLCYDSLGGHSVEFVSFNQGAQLWPPQTIIANINSNVCGGTVTAWFSPGDRPIGFDELGAEMRIRLYGICPAPGGSNFQLEILHLPSMDTACAELCAISLSCYDYDISIQCPGCVRHGTENTNYSMRRTTYGLADNDNNGVADPSGVLDFSKIATDKAMVGDTLVATATAFVQRLTYPDSSFSDTLFKFGYYGHTIQDDACREALTPWGALVRFYDADTTDTGCFTCARTYEFTIDTSGQSWNGKELIYDFSFHRMPGYGFTPASNHFSYGIPIPGGEDILRDSIIVMPKFKVTTNVGPVELICFTGPNRIFLGIDADPMCVDPLSGSCEPVPGLGVMMCDTTNIQPQCDGTIRYGCTFQNGVFKLAGYEYLMLVEAQGFRGAEDNCARPIVVTNSFKIGPPAFNNYFPYEYRNWGITDTVAVTIPFGFVRDTIRIDEIRLKGSDSVVVQTIRPVSPCDSLIDSLGNLVLLFNTAQYFSSPSDIAAACNDDCVTSQLYPGDDDFTFKLTVYAYPNCLTLADTFNLNAFIGYDSVFCQDSVSIFSDTRTDGPIVYTPPAFQLNAGNKIIDGVTRQACWEEYELKNVGGNASNFWMIDSTPSGNITITSITVDGVTFLDSNGVFQIGSFPFSTLLEPAKRFTICAEYACDTLTEDSVYIYFGWDCPDYPTSRADYRCEPDSFVLTLWPKISILQNSVTLSADSINICDTLAVDISVNSAGVGNLYDILVETEIIGGAFIDTATFKFPGASLTPPQPINIPGLVNDIYTWNINNLILSLPQMDFQDRALFTMAIQVILFCRLT